jgi:hypothetical protein
LRLQSVANVKPPGIEVVSAKSVVTCTGSIGQYGAEPQVEGEVPAEQDPRASRSTASGRDESERVDASWVGPKGGSFRTLGQGVGGWRCGAAPLLPPPARQGSRRQHQGPGILNDGREASEAALPGTHVGRGETEPPGVLVLVVIVEAVAEPIWSSGHSHSQRTNAPRSTSLRTTPGSQRD